MSSNPWVTSSNSRVTSSDPRLRNIRVKRKNTKFKNIEFHDFTVSNETILATKQEFFFAKVAPVQSITDIVLLGFSLILLPWMFISYYIIIYFFVKNFFWMFIFQRIRYSNVLICLWLRNRSSIKYVRNYGNGEGSFKMLTDGYRGRGVSPFMCTYALTLSLFMFLSCGVLFYLQKFNITFIQKGCVCQKWLFFSNEINFCWNEISFFLIQIAFPNQN